MICPYCKQDIPDSSAYCPECGCRVTPKYKTTGVWKYIALIVVMVLIVGVLYQELMEKLDGNSNASESQTVSQTVEPTATPKPSQRAIMENPTDLEDVGKKSNSQPKTQTPSPFDDDIIDVDINDCHIKYLYHEVVENLAGDVCVAVYYEFTNNTNENQEFDFTVSDKAFQNGVELEGSIFHVNDDSKTSGMEIQPGVSVTVCSGFVLRDKSDVEIQISPWISFSDTPSDAMLLSVE